MEPSEKNKKRKCLIWCGIILILILVIVAVLLFLRFYLFRTKAPEISTNDVFLTDFASSRFSMTSLKITLRVVIGLRNPNYGGFEYRNTTTTVLYHGTEVGVAPMDAGTIAARSSATINTTVYIDTAKMTASNSFLMDRALGAIPLTTTTTLIGKANVFKVMKLHATVTTDCTVSIAISTATSTADCTSKVQL
ncbi:hypothetical protein LUZ60_010735 [Juncus effusus]|nr:hypothetical protein LUZ60_010735 [Juncus effusus]